MRTTDRLFSKRPLTYLLTYILIISNSFYYSPETMLCFGRIMDLPIGSEGRGLGFDNEGLALASPSCCHYL